MSLQLRVLVFALLIGAAPSVCLAQAAPTIPSNAIFSVRMTAGAPAIGAGVVLAPGAAADGSVQVSLPTGADGKASCVVYRTAPTDTTTGLCVQLGLSDMQVRIGSAGVSLGDPLNIADNTGAWQTANLGSANTYLIALRSCAANSLCWAGPHHGRPLSVASPAWGSVAGSTSDPSRSAASASVIAEMTLSLTTSGGPLFCAFSGSFKSNPGDSGFIALFVDGAEVPGTRRLVGTSLSVLGLSGSVDSAQAVMTIGTVSAAAHTVDARWAATAGSIRANGTQRNLSCRELN